MTEKRFSIKEGSIIGLSSIYTDNGKVMTQLEVLDVLIKQHETIQTLTKENEQLKQSYAQLKHRHSLLHDVCLDAECERDSLKKDVESLENENEQLKQTNQRLNDELQDCMGKLALKR